MPCYLYAQQKCYLIGLIPAYVYSYMSMGAYAHTAIQTDRYLFHFVYEPNNQPVSFRFLRLWVNRTIVRS